MRGFRRRAISGKRGESVERRQWQQSPSPDMRSQADDQSESTPSVLEPNKNDGASSSSSTPRASGHESFYAEHEADNVDTLSLSGGLKDERPLSLARHASSEHESMIASPITVDRQSSTPSISSMLLARRSSSFPHITTAYAQRETGLTDATNNIPMSSSSPFFCLQSDSNVSNAQDGIQPPFNNRPLPVPLPPLPPIPPSPQPHVRSKYKDSGVRLGRDIEDVEYADRMSTYTFSSGPSTKPPSYMSR